MRELEAIHRQVAHRVAGHRAGLAKAEELGWPHILTDAVAETRARLEESLAILEIIEQAMVRP